MGSSPAPADLPQIGDTFAGKYSIVRVVGEGGMGIVYEAMHLRLRQRVAIKMLLPRVLRVPDVIERFEREGRTAAQLRSRNVARIFDVDLAPSGLPYMVMEYLEGQDLDQELQKRGSLPVDEAVGYILQACDAMSEAHAAGIVHRDLKPANLFLCPERDGNERVVKVLDFGISKLTEDAADARLTGTHATMGTPLYMSPEQVRSSKNVDARSDVWSLGVILFELITSRPPFLGSNFGAAVAIVNDPPPPMSEFRTDVPAALEHAIAVALAKDPNGRFATVRDFADAIASFGPPPVATGSSGRHGAQSAGRISGPSFPASSARASRPSASVASPLGVAATLAQTGPAPRRGSSPIITGQAAGSGPRLELVSAPDLRDTRALAGDEGTARRRDPALGTAPGWATLTKDGTGVGGRRAIVALAVAAPVLLLIIGFGWRSLHPYPSPAAPSHPDPTRDAPTMAASVGVPPIASAPEPSLLPPVPSVPPVPIAVPDPPPASPTAHGLGRGAPARKPPTPTPPVTPPPPQTAAPLPTPPKPPPPVKPPAPTTNPLYIP